MNFPQWIEAMGDFSDLAVHDQALKFWLPEPAMQALKELSEIQSESYSEALRKFFAQHCYGVYAFHLMNQKRPGLFGDSKVFFSRKAATQRPAQKRQTTYWVPQLGKNIIAVKVWVPARLAKDLKILAAHVDLNLSQYLREIVISRLLGHGTLPQRPAMMYVTPLPAAQDWCNGLPVPLRLLEPDEIHGGALEDGGATDAASDGASDGGSVDGGGGGD